LRSRELGSESAPAHALPSFTTLCVAFDGEALSAGTGAAAGASVTGGLAAAAADDDDDDDTIAPVAADDADAGVAWSVAVEGSAAVAFDCSSANTSS